MKILVTTSSVLNTFIVLIFLLLFALFYLAKNEVAPFLADIESNSVVDPAGIEIKIGSPESIFGRRLIFQSGEILLNKDTAFLTEDTMTIKRFFYKAHALNLRDYLCSGSVCVPIRRMSSAWVEHLDRSS